MSDLRVLFDSTADGSYRAQLANADDNRLGTEVPFTPFLTEDDYEDLRWYLEEYMDLPDGGAVVRAQRIERELDRWGRMYDALFTACCHGSSRRITRATSRSACPGHISGAPGFQVRADTSLVSQSGTTDLFDVAMLAEKGIDIPAPTC